MAKKKKCRKKNPTQKRNATSKKRNRSNNSKKPKKEGLRTQIVKKVPSKVRIKGGKSKSASKSKYGSMKVESEYKDLQVGK